MEHPPVHNPENSSIHNSKKPGAAKKGFLNKIRKPAERLAQTAALITSLSAGVETVKPEIGLNQSTEERIKWIKDLKDREEEEGRLKRREGR